MLCGAIEKVMKEWADNKGWGSEEFEGDNEEVYVFHHDWRTKGKDEDEYTENAWFHVDEVEGADDAIGGSSYMAAQLCGVGIGSSAVWWNWEKEEYGYNRARRWKPFIAPYVERLQQAG